MRPDSPMSRTGRKKPVGDVRCLSFGKTIILGERTLHAVVDQTLMNQASSNIRLD
jgi:hypothetical protein